MRLTAVLVLPLAAVLLLALLSCSTCELDGFDPEEDAGDEDIEDGFGVAAGAAAESQQHLQHHSTGDAELSVPESGIDVDPVASDQPVGKPVATGKRDSGAFGRATSIFPPLFLEATMVAILILYALNFFLGKLRNESMALEWANTFCSDGALLERNFSLLGPGDTSEGEIMMKESYSIFKFYASGRRYCRGMLATLDLRRRQDLLSYLLYVIMPKDDTLEVEVYMNESNMPPMVFAIGEPREVKALHKDRKDLRIFAKLVNIRDRVPRLAADHFACYAESKEVATDIISLALNDVVLEDAWASAGRYLQSILVSSESNNGAHSKGLLPDKLHLLAPQLFRMILQVIRVVFKLPARGNMGELTTALAAVPSLIDAVGSYKMSADAKKRAEERRRKVSEEAFNSRQKREEREEIVTKKRAEKAAAEKERLARMTPEARAKAEEKKEKLQHRRNAKAGIKVMK